MELTEFPEKSAFNQFAFCSGTPGPRKQKPICFGEEGFQKKFSGCSVAFSFAMTGTDFDYEQTGNFATPRTLCLSLDPLIFKP